MALFGGVAHAGTILYELTTVLPGMSAWAINESDQVAGWNYINDRAQIYTPGSGIFLIPLPVGATQSIGYTINEAGQVAGRLYGLSNYDQNGYYVNNGFIYTPGATPSVRSIVGEVGFDYVLNEAGMIVKLSSPAPSSSTGSIVTGVAGEYAAGYSFYLNGDGSGQAWRRNPDGTFTELSTLLGTRESQAYGINSSGTVVGRAIPQNGGLSAFVYSDSLGALNLFDVTDTASLAGWASFSSAQDITEDGRIIGWGYYTAPNGYQSTLSSFILTPIGVVPEPSTISLLSAAACCLLILRRKSVREKSIKRI